MKNSFDRVITSTPVNKTAATVTRSKGEHWEPETTENLVRSDVPLPTVPFLKAAVINGAQDLTGTVFGHMKVIGYSGFKGADGIGRWVCRCVCGAYEHRRGTFIRRYDPSKMEVPEKCFRCHKSDRIKTKLYQKGIPK